MAYLISAVVLVGLLCLLDLVLTVGVIRRLREHTRLLSQVPRGATAGLPAGETVAEFTATTIDGTLVSRELLAGRTLVGFFSPGCQPCAEQLPRFVEFARSMPDGSEQVLAVVTDDSSGSGSGSGSGYAEKLAPSAKVVVEEPGGPVQAAFQVTGFPTVFLVDAGGAVVAGGSSLDALGSVPAAETARAA